MEIMSNKKLYLSPINGRKSFYNKAYVEFMSDGTLVCYSYNTPVARWKSGKFERLWDDYSATTMNHINSFAAYCGINKGGKKWWDSLEVVNN